MNPQMPQLDKKWSVATFSIFSEILTSDEIGSALGLVATRTHAKGQPRGARKKDGSISTAIVWPHSAWHLRSSLGCDRLDWRCIRSPMRNRIAGGSDGIL